MYIYSLKESEDGQLLTIKKLKNLIKNKNVSVLDLHQLHEKLNLSYLPKIRLQNKTRRKIQFNAMSYVTSVIITILKQGILKGPVQGTYYGHYCLRPPQGFCCLSALWGSKGLDLGFWYDPCLRKRRLLSF